ncbi:MAG: ribosomal RNA small subunit methyltransferase A [Verrucomicrobia bacterium]|nr:ribosomal RNA small subunit methyltransferase A [Verrucomicrobiota bacterium]
MTLSEMRQLLASRDLQLTKSLGQNFLHDGNQLRRIAAAAELAPSDKVLEIGPGLGPLTELLLAGAGEVLAIEKDARLCEILRESFAGAKNFTLLHEDALDLLQREQRDWSGWKLVANLPYSVASPILVELAQAERPPERMVATLQLEVVHHIAAATGSADYGLLSLLLQLRYEPRGWFKIPATCFFPPPDVASACVTLVRRTTPLLEFALHKTFERIVRRGFSQRRKMFFKLLTAEWPVDALTNAFTEVELDRTVRAEAVALEQFVRLAVALNPQSHQPNES